MITLYDINCEYDYHLQYLRLSQTCDIAWKMPFIQQYYFTLALGFTLLVYSLWGGLTGLYHCRHINYHHAFRLYHVLFSIKPECSAEQLLAVDPSYCSLYPSKQAINHFMLLHAFTVFYFPTWNFKQVLLVDSSAHVLADY